MTQEEYINSVRGINDGSDLPLELLLDVYSDIASHEIQIPDGDVSSVVTDASWRFMMQQNKTIVDARELAQHLDPQALDCLGNLDMPRSIDDGSAFDRDIFLVVCRSVLAALAVGMCSTCRWRWRCTLLIGFGFGLGLGL
jgi:Sec7-like guanine-nucleotide exchange factor